MIGDAVRALPARWRKLAEGFRNGTDIGNAEAACLVVSAAELDAALCPTRHREADRARFPDKGFNEWLDTGISDCGHTVWDGIDDICAAWHGWDAHRTATMTDEPAPWDLEQAAAPVGVPDGWRAIADAPTGKLCIVGWLDARDPEAPERHDFDYIEDGRWVRHDENVEHAELCAPAGSVLPPREAPYQWFIEVPGIAAAPSPVAEGSEQ